METIACGIHIEEGRMAMLMCGTFKEVTTEEDQRALRALEMLRHLPVAVCQFDMDGNVMEQNPEALAEFGTSSAQERQPVQGMNSPLENVSYASDDTDESTVTDVDDEEDEDGFEALCCQFVSRFVDQDLGRRVLQDAKNGKDCSLEALQHTVLGQKWSLVRVRKTKDPVTSEPVILYSARDITQVVEAKQQAENANMAKSDFFALMAHEIRTPLHHVVSAVELVSQTEPTKEESDLQALLRSSSKVLMTVINDLFDRMDGNKEKISLEQASFNLKDVVDCTMTTLSPKAKNKGLYMQVNMSNRLAGMSFIGDQNRLRQLLFNLLHNSCKYTFTGGIDLTIKRHSKIQHNRTWLRFTISDTGPGITLKERRRLFENQPLSHLNNDSGVGLSICKALVDAMGGRIGVNSQAGSGSTFWFELPFRRSTSKTSLRTLEPVPDEGGLRILLADCDAFNCQNMTAMFEKTGNTVVTCADGPSMISHVQQSTFDVVLAEINLPGMSGIDAVRRVRDMGYSRESLPILAMSTTPPAKDFADMGMNDWLTKPLLMKDIKSAMTNAMCNGASSVGTSVFTGSCEGTFYGKRGSAEPLGDNLVSMFEAGLRTSHR